MSRKYTAQDMRETADGLKDDPGMDALIIADMLRQAADMMEREKKFEYGIDYIKSNGNVCSNYQHFGSLQQAKRYSTPLPDEEVRFVRREVGEWEEVEDEGNKDGGKK